MTGNNVNEEIEHRNDKSEGYQDNASANPRQERSFAGQNEGISVQAICPSRVFTIPSSVWPQASIALHVSQGTLIDQVSYVRHTGIIPSFHLVYLDPPFYTGKQLSADAGEFSDEWPDLKSYLTFIEQQVSAVSDVLDPKGFFVLHCDWHASHYLKMLGDAIFGYGNFRNEIVWHYTGRRSPARIRVNAKHDTLLIWAKSGQATMYPVFESWDRDYYVRMKKQKVHQDEEGREWIWGHQGRGRSHAYRIYLDEVLSQGRAIDTVWDMPIVNTSAKERVGYPTQKPVKLLMRLLELLTKPGDWVGDFMAGSGTTADAAAKTGRNIWVGDQNPQAVELMIRRIHEMGASSGGD